MTTLDAESIMRLALSRGNFVTLHFLKSEAVANAVATRLLVELHKIPGRSTLERRRIRITASEAYPGTWDIRVMAGIPLPTNLRKSSNTANIAANRRQIDEVMTAFRASFTAQDLVDRYTFPSR